MMTITSSSRIPVLPLRDIVVFPHMIVPLFVGREKSVRALEEVMGSSKQILLLTQTDAATEDPETGDMFAVGTIGNILQLLKLPDGTVKVLVEGISRAKVDDITATEGYMIADVREYIEDDETDSETVALGRATIQQFEHYIKLNKKIASEVMVSVNQLEDTSKIADTIASHLAVKIAEKQSLLEMVDVQERLEAIYGMMESEISVLQVEKRVRNRVKRQMEKTQREYYLNEQMKAIQKELGEGEDGKNETDELEELIKSAKMPKEAKEKAETELKKLRNMGPMSAEATVVRNYLDWMTSLPWKKASRLNNDINKASEILDADH
ncbi:MAG: LON peptidase substrate-binding domain-containing protein, partial [Candidatus Puniceispirillaceae bacterium]